MKLAHRQFMELQRCRSSTQRRGHATQRGAASLVVVMVLFFIVSLVAAYTSRNLIFEQRTSVNQYRSTQAFEAAEAGLEWAVTLLNSGRIGPDCLEAGATTADTSFRQRYLAIDTSTNATAGNVRPRLRANGEPLWPSCVWDGAAWQCNCPTNAAPALAAPGGTGVYPAFRVRFALDGVTSPGVVRVESQGCTRLDNACLDFSATAVDLEGRARLSVLVALKSALTTPPAAALTVLGNVAGGGAIKAYNTNPELGGVTVQAGGDITNPGAFVLRSLPGTPGPASMISIDTSLSDLAATPDRLFASVFGAWPGTYRLQPAALRLDCPVAGCRAALAAAVAMNPDRVIWVPGNLRLESAGDVGSPPDPANPAVPNPLVAELPNLLFPGPAVIIVNGSVQVDAAVSVFGLVYATSGINLGAGEFQGALFIADDLAAAAAPTAVLDGGILDILRRRQGSFVRLPGSWRDFQ